MVKVTFIRPEGSSTDLEAAEGNSVMEVAVHGGIDEILADCGGALSCATCHVYVAPEWFDRVGSASPDEEAMLEFAVDQRENSRLCCQIKLTGELDGLIVEVPARQQ